MMKIKKINPMNKPVLSKNQANCSSLIKTLILHLPFDVVVKKIYVQTCLNNTTNVSYPIMFVVRFMMGSVDPIYYVKSTVGTK